LAFLQVAIATNRIAIEFVGDVAHMTEVNEALVARLPIATESVVLLFVLHCNLLRETRIVGLSGPTLQPSG
jgi:hypothetical protein